MKLPLHRGSELVATTLVDDDDASRVEGHVWRLHSAGYAHRVHRAAGRAVSVLLHRDLLGLVPGDGLEVDHINGDRLDNQRANLRVVTRAQNAQNIAAKGQSPHRGVYPHRGGYAAAVTIGGRRHWLGRFQTEDEAAAAVARARSEHMHFTNPARDARLTGAAS